MQRATAMGIRKLNIQFDNMHLESFVWSLLKYGDFLQVYLSFLVKGHTHEDIDQHFSKISHHLRKSNAMTLPQLQQAIVGSFTGTINAEILGAVFDIKSWIGEYLNDIQNHSFPHQFW